MTNKYTKYISVISAILVLLIAIFAFILSFDAIRNLAIEHHIPPKIAFMAPFIIDGLMVVLSVSVLRSALLGESTKLNWLFIFVFTGVSIAFNIEHSDKTIPGMGFSILYPVSLLIAFESFMHQIRSGVQRAATISNISTLKVELSKLQNTRDKKQSEISKLEDRIENQRAKAKDETEKLKEEIRQLKLQKASSRLKPEQIAMRVIIENDPNISKSQIGRLIGKAPSTITTYATQLNVHKNGKGWQIK